MNVIELNNTEDPLIRIRIINNEHTTIEEKAEQSDYLKIIEQSILDILPMRGIPNILKVLYKNENKEHNKIVVNE